MNHLLNARCVQRFLSLFFLFFLSTFSFQSLAQDFKPDANMPRSEVPDEYKWNTLHIFPGGDEEWEETAAALGEKIPQLAESCEGKLGQSAEMFYRCFDGYHQLEEKALHLLQYATFNYHVDLRVAETRSRAGKAGTLGTTLSSHFAFLSPEVTSIGETKVRSFMDAEPDLRKYAFALSEIFRLKDHTLPPEQEKILAELGNFRGGPGEMSNAIQIDTVWKSFSTTGKKKRKKKHQEDMNIQNWGRYRVHPNRRVRESAADAFLGSLMQHGNVWAQNLMSELHADTWESKIRGYDGSTLRRKLDGNGVPLAVFDNLIETVGANLSETLHPYIALKKRILGLSEFRFHDNYASLLPSYNAEINYEDARQKVAEAFKPLGQEAVDVFLQGSAPGSGWADVYANENKRSGAYNWGVPGIHTYILMNYTDTYNDMFTFAHEFGHGVHSYYANKTQPYVYRGPAIFTAEVASTGMEMLLYQALVEDAERRGDRDMLLFLYDFQLDSMRQTLIRQTQFAEFEKIIHERVANGETLTLKDFNEIYTGLIRKYYGPDFVIGELDGIEWTFINHFYRSFYVYQYATSLSASIAVAQGIRDGEINGQVFVDFLSAGSSANPTELVAGMGVDMTTTKPVQQACDYFKELLAKFEKLYFEENTEKGRSRSRKKKS